MRNTFQKYTLPSDFTLLHNPILNDMRIQIIQFHRPESVLQIYRNIHIYDKTMKSFDDREEAMRWKDISSQSGFIRDNALYLPEAAQEINGFRQCDLITVEDDRLPLPSPAYSHNPQRFANRCFHLSKPAKADIFRIERKGTDMELHLEYGYFEIGIPGGENFKLCNLVQHQPVEILINGKTNHTMSFRRERLFKEQSYIIEYCGDFDECFILPPPVSPVCKKIPAERKVINLLKPFKKEHHYGGKHGRVMH